VKILVLSSTFPYLDHHNHPRFVNALCEHTSQNNEVHILAPSISGEEQSVEPLLNNQKLHLFRYCFSTFEKLTGGSGITENIKNNRMVAFTIPFFMASQILRCGFICRKENFDIIHAHWIIPQALSAVLAKKIFRINIPILVTSHGGDLYTSENKLSIYIKSWILSQCDKISVVSESMKAHCIKTYNCAPSKLAVAPMGVELKKFTPVARETTEDIILFIGRLVEKKGTINLINAFPKVLEKRPSAKLLIAGSGHELELLQSVVKTKNLTHQVRFLGNVAHNQLPKLINQAKTVVLPFIVANNNDQEGLGLTTIEAMGCEKAVIVGDVPAVHDVIKHKVNGLIVNGKDSNDIANKIIEVLSNEKERTTLAKRGRKSVLDKFDWNKVADTYTELYNKIIKEYKC